MPIKSALEGLESRWGQVWHEDGIYAFRRPASREQVFSTDTPPSTVSGSLHVGYVFSYTHAGTIARYQRMRGKEVFYPMGQDSDGLPTERRVQNHYGARCGPSLPHGEDFTPPAKPDPKRQMPISRRNSIELCEKLIAINEKAFKDLWWHLELSIDWDTLYTTTSPATQAVAQRVFVCNLARGEAYLSLAPTMWDVAFQTVVAQVELESREHPGAYHHVASHGADGPVFIEITRSELLPSICTLIAHPDDGRYRYLLGTAVTSSVFGVEIPVLAHTAAKLDKGAGIATYCIFGDLTGVQWWRGPDLPTRTIIGRDSRPQREVPEWLTDAEPWIDLVGKTVLPTRAAVVELLCAFGDLDGEPKPISRPVNFYEKGDKPLGTVATCQWYLPNGGRDKQLEADLLKHGTELAWTPEHMRHRYDNWVGGLNGDWLISRQWFFGVPFPVRYPLDADGESLYDQMIVADEASLPVDSVTACPSGYEESQRGIPGEFIADPDVVDTWVTSSLTPQIAPGWECDEELSGLTFPMGIAPQGHDVIRTRLLSRTVRANFENHSPPWRRTTISGLITDPNRKKMSKSKGNVVVPPDILEHFGSDAARWCATMVHPGMDSPFDQSQTKVGRRLAMKILNAGKFVLGLALEPGDPAVVTNPVDRAPLVSLSDVVTARTGTFGAFDYIQALETAEIFFWSFCDDYPELVKERTYGSQGPEVQASAQLTLAITLDVQLWLSTPFLPFMTEETRSQTHGSSIHRSPWPTAGELAIDGDRRLLANVAPVLIMIRGAKLNAGVSMETPVRKAVFLGDHVVLERLKAIEADLRAAGHITSEVVWKIAEGPLIVEAELKEPPTA